MQSLSLGAQDDGPIRIVGGVMRDGIDSGISGVIGDLRWLGGGGTGPMAVDLEWNAGSARASLKGTIEAPIRFTGFALDVAVNVPKPLQVADDAPPALRAVAFQTRLTDAPGPVPFQFTSNAGDLTGEWSVTRLAKSASAQYSVEGQVASQRLDLDMLLARPPGITTGGTGAPEPSSPSEPASPPDRLLIPDARLPFNLLRAIDADIKLALADVRFHGVDIRKIDSVAALRDGQLRVAPFTIAAPDQRMSGTLLADATKTPPVVHLSVSAPALALQPLLGALGPPEVASGTAQVQADLTGSGETPHAIAASLDGWAGVAIEGGQLDTKMMNAWLDQVQPLHFSGPDVTELRCFALRADLKSGVATIEPVALNTPALIVDGSGDVDLGQETLALQMRPRAKIGGTGFAVPVRVSGPLREPSAKIDISAKGLARPQSGLLLGGKDVMGAAGGGDPCPAALAASNCASRTTAGRTAASRSTARPWGSKAVKRFWDTVTLSQDGPEHRILLDGKPIHLPTGGVLLVGPPALAAAIAEEWRLAGGAKSGEMSFADTPLTRVAGTARERIAADPVPTADAIARYGETDLLCYRAEFPARSNWPTGEARSWQPWLDWAAARFAAPLRVTTGVVPVRQHHDSINAFAAGGGWVRSLCARRPWHRSAGIGQFGTGACAGRSAARCR